LWLKQRTRALPVFLPKDGIGPVRQMLEAGCIFEELLLFPAQFHALHTHESIQIGNVRVTPFRTTHLDNFRRRFQKRYPQNFDAFCFLMQTETLRVGHSADIGAPEDLAPILEQPLDLLVCELAHVNPEELFRFLKGYPIQRLVLIHLAQPQLERVDELRALAAEYFVHSQVTFAVDGHEAAF
jgi:hypothetical protein